MIVIMPTINATNPSDQSNSESIPPFVPSSGSATDATVNVVGVANYSAPTGISITEYGPEKRS